MTPWRIVLAGLVVLAGPTGRAQTIPLDPVTVTAARTAQPAAQVPFAVATLDGDALRASPTVTLDGALRSVPGFSLFRRSDSLTANPTTQGVSLRGLGPSGASRSLVLLDGVPLNDPFGGWVAWSMVPRESLAGAEIVQGGGATAWGNAALGGVVQLLTAPPAGPAGRLTATYGSFSTRSAELAVDQPMGKGTLQFSGRAFATDGFVLVAPEDRGPVDLAAWSRHDWLGARWIQPVGDDLQLTITGRTFAEERGNGTAYQRNSSRENFGSVALATRPGRTFGWTAQVYGQDQTFASTFSSINSTRTAETPASDQFAVPATAFGAAWTGVWQTGNGARTSAGVDYRGVRGETRENYSYVAGTYTRQRRAGGTQDFAGVFVLHERPLASDLRATLGARVDDWRDSDGHRLETDRATGTVLRDDHYAEQTGLEFSPTAGLVWQPAPAWRAHAAAQQSFRRPTLNELYRPFRAGSVITEANPALATEHTTSAELGLDHTRGQLTLGAALFWNELHDAVANVTLVHGPGTFPEFGFIPAGGVGRQRLNLDRLQVRGLELTAEWRPTPSIRVNAAYLYDDTTVLSAPVAPALVGKQLAQVPRHSATLGATWQAPGGVRVTPRLRALGRQFEDDENLLILGSVVVVDLGVSYAFGHGHDSELFLTMENLGDARVETGRSADGIVNTGTPRLLLAGLRCAW